MSQTNHTTTGTAPAKIGAVLVVGGGIAGMESAITLADSGYKVYLLTNEPSVGGRMAQLDKTFPTNDCSTCMISPRMVAVGSHPNIDIMTLSELESLDGIAGNFTAHVLHKATYVDPDKCTGCEECVAKCPSKVANEYNENLNQRRAISLMFPQAVPRKCYIDAPHCIRLTKGKCGICEKTCKAGAINYADADRRETISVGAVILAPGYKLTAPSLLGEFGYGRVSNVYTSLEFERMLSATGPSTGHITRRSDGAEPKRIAFIQCVGSRNERIDRGYCSSVCCMYATKQAIIAKEHVPGAEITIFYKDIRAFGKGFERYWQNARDKYGVQFVKAMVSSVKGKVKTGNAALRYYAEDGTFRESEFDAVVLSCGLSPSPDGIALCNRVGVEVDKYGFALTPDILAPVATTREGVFVSGVFEGPKDIPESVVQSTGAAGQVMALLGSERGSLTHKKEYPPEKEIGAQDRIGVFVCHCGLNIASVVDVPDVVAQTAAIPDVVHSENLVFTCSKDSQDHIADVIKSKDLNRVVIAACSPRTHEPLFREMLKGAGLNPYMFEMANIRDHCSWVHGSDSSAATAKATDLTKMAIAKSRLLRPLKNSELEISSAAVVVGGGVSGMTSALSLAAQGFDVHLIERDSQLGGEALKLRYHMDGSSIPQSVAKLADKVAAEPRVTLHLDSTLSAITGSVGQFRSRIATGTATTEITHGAIVVATGATEYKPVEYAYGESDAIYTNRALEQALADGKIPRERLSDVVFIQCVGSRNDEHNYCSRVCCSQSIKLAIQIKKANPESRIYILYRDIRTYGLREKYYREARDLGIVFVRFVQDDPPAVSVAGGNISVIVRDRMMNQVFEIEATAVSLAAGTVAREDTRELSHVLKVSRSQDGFFQEAHVKLRPIDFASEGEYMCGTAHSPMSVDEAVSQGLAAAARAGSLLGRDTLESDAHVATVVPELCAGCVTCTRVCPYGVPRMNLQGKAEISPAACHGCGTCAAQCPAKAIDLPGFTDEQFCAMCGTAFASTK